MKQLSVSTGNSVKINGQTFKGNNVSISNGRVIVDGVEQTSEQQYKFEITVNGDVDKLELESGTVVVKGNVNCSLNTTNGDVECGDVSGDVKTTNGDVDCDNVAGRVSTINGNVKHRGTR
ncbi:hypothetical protein NVP1081O_151 [Vibrio phage 1.081.O._10N.286.52.C2]|nr:hypothetical protein NVP1081O_151 [Vibrio phage 1.081.O._10N.286.52.C2]